MGGLHYLLESKAIFIWPSTDWVMTSERFNDKVVVITGSSAGIGQDAALEFGKEGASVVIHGQSIERLQQTKVLLKEAGVSEDKILVVVGSMDQPGTPTKIINETIKKFGKIDVW
uniref:Uncharacterized protein n=1 Tax=Ditylenchus dipsaci TaxID=166011 RepID=A0A915DQY5_9BILA